MASRLQDVLLRGTLAARPLATAVAKGTLYYSTDTQQTHQSDGTTWNTYTDASAAAISSVVISKLAAPWFPEQEEIIYEPQIPIPGPAGPAAVTTAKIYSTGITIDGGGVAITTGIKGYISIPVAGTIVRSRMLANISGSAVMDVWKDTYANYPPTVADTITAAAKPTIVTALKSEDTTLTGWTTAVAAGDVLGFNVDSATTITRLTLELWIQP